MKFLSVFLLALTLSVPAAQASGKFDKDYIGEIEVYRAKFEDTLVHLARDNNLGFVEMRAANPDLDPWIPGAGAKVVLPGQHLLPDAPREGIVINLPEMRLYAYKKKGEAPQAFPIGIGREGLKTPTGKTSIAWKKEGPIWRPTERMREEDPELPVTVYPGPENPMGTHAMYLDWPLYAIHGTNRPFGIGRRISSGCIRLYPEDIITLYEDTKKGTPVQVVDQAIKVGWIEEKMYIEVHPTQEQSVRVEEDGELESYEITSEDMKRIIAKSGEFSTHIDWQRVRKAVKERRGYPVAVLNKKREPGSWVKDDLEELLEEADADEEVIKLTEAKPQEEDTPFKEKQKSRAISVSYND